jgi:hypothetical protein
MSGIAFDGCENLWQQDVVIASGGSVASGLDTSGRAIVGIQMPSGWTAAKLGFEVSLDGVTWQTAYDNGGNLEQATVDASRFICIPLTDAIFAPFVRLKSVDASNVAVVQSAARTLTLILRRYLGGA